MLLRHGSEQRPRFSQWRFTLTLIFSSVIVMSLITLWWAERQLGPPFVEWARVRATNTATQMINRAVHKALSSHMETDRLIEFIGGDGQPFFINYQLGLLNQVITEAVAHVSQELDELKEEDLPLPLGELSGMHLLAGRGPRIPVRMLTSGAVTAVPQVDFHAAGINQVAHRIYLDVEVEMLVVAPFVRTPITVSQSVMVAEAILPGEVPRTYVNFVGFSGSLSEWMALTGGGKGLP